MADQNRKNNCVCGAKLESRETDCATCVRAYLTRLVQTEIGLLILRDFYDRNERLQFIVK